MGNRPLNLCTNFSHPHLLRRPDWTIGHLPNLIDDGLMMLPCAHPSLAMGIDQILVQLLMSPLSTDETRWPNLFGPIFYIYELHVLISPAPI